MRMDHTTEPICCLATHRLSLVVYADLIKQQEQNMWATSSWCLKEFICTYKKASAFSTRSTKQPFQTISSFCFPSLPQAPPPDILSLLIHGAVHQPLPCTGMPASCSSSWVCPNAAGRSLSPHVLIQHSFVYSTSIYGTSTMVQVLF